jgi:uncharacterized protein YecT (DUF1311 family)
MKDGDSVSVAAQLEKLEALRAGGSLSDSEFQKLKSALLTNVTVVPKSSSLSAAIIGALAAIAVVVVVFLVAWPRHVADKPVPVAPPQPAQASAPETPPQPQAATQAPAMAGPPADAMPAVAPPVFQTSFDCSQAKSLALKMICADPNLAAQDVQLAALYRRARANAVDPSQLSDQQQEWLAARDSCRSAGCVATVYAQRRAELAQWITR